MPPHSPSSDAAESWDWGSEIVGIGAGGHAGVVIDAILAEGRYRVAGLIDRDRTLHGRSRLGILILGGDEALHSAYEQGVRIAFVGIGGVRDNVPRTLAYEAVSAMGYYCPPIIHPRAYIGRSADIGLASVILANAVVNTGARIGRNVIVNTGSVVEHDCDVGDHVHIAPGVRMGGSVTVGASAHIGIGATIRNGVSIGTHSVIGAGAVVISDVQSAITVVGVPARPIR